VEGWDMVTLFWTRLCMQSWAENLSERQLASEKSHAVKTEEKSKVGVFFKH
jgi:hypothetical protein